MEKKCWAIVVPLVKVSKTSRATNIFVFLTVQAPRDYGLTPDTPQVTMVARNILC